MSIVDRPFCEHGRLYCPEGCHDGIAYREGCEGMHIFLDLAEMVANGDMPEFEATLDPRSGKDGAEEATEAVMLMLIQDSRQ